LGDASSEEISGALETLDVATLGVLRIGATHVDRAAMSSPDLLRWEPRLVVVELSPKELEDSPMLASAYVVGGFDGVNSYLARADDANAVANLYPSCSRDDFVTTDMANAAAELDRLLKLVAGYERESEQAVGADRAVLTAPSPQRRRYAARHVMVRTPVITLDRVVVLASPETNGKEFAELLSAGLEADLRSIAHPADIEWDRLPERVVIATSTPFSEMFRVHLVSNGFRVVVIARDPLEQELSRQIISSGKEPSAEEFMREAVGADAAARLELTSRWLVEPGTVRVDFEQMRVDLLSELIRLFEELGVAVTDGSTFARRLSPAASELQERLDGASAEHLKLGRGELDAFSSAHRLVFERLGIASRGELPAEKAVPRAVSTEAEIGMRS
jgi:hypothetical protein